MDDFEVHPVGTSKQLQGAGEANDLARMTARALRAEGILATIGRRLDDYRERGQAMPSYAELVRLLQG